MYKRQVIVLSPGGYQKTLLVKAIVSMSKPADLNILSINKFISPEKGEPLLSSCLLGDKPTHNILGVLVPR